MSNKLEKFLWSELFRPNTLNDCILPESIKDQIRGMYKDGLTHLLFYGQAGTGKTTLARVIANDTDSDMRIFNGSSGELNIDALRNDVSEFSHYVSLRGKGHKKIIIIDEADGLSPVVQGALRHTMEKYNTVRFILTANYPDKIIPALHSRCSTISFNFNQETLNDMIKLFAKRCTEILTKMNVEYDVNALINVIKRYYPDNRKILNELQRYSKRNGSIDAGMLDFMATNMDELFTLINNKDFSGLKSFLSNNDTTSMFNQMYSVCEKYIPKDHIPAFVLSLGNYQRFHGTVPNQELNIITSLLDYMIQIS